MNSQQTVHVDLGARSYDIFIGAGLLKNLATILKQRLAEDHVVIISDENVARHYLDTTSEQFRECIHRVDSIVVAPGENTKSVEQAEAIWKQLIDLGTDRKSTIVALGGGVVGDLAGFAAATYARGIGFVQIPTTLLAQVDSSVGGKVGINLPSAKNIVGSFWQPEFVAIDPTVLSTLDEREFKSGLAEVIKYGVILDEPFFQCLDQSIQMIADRDPTMLAKIIQRSCELKAQIVKEDETERSGRRAILNYGHTFGHAIETVYGYGHFTHGEAIAIGMNCAARLAIKMGMASRDLLDRQIALMTALGLPVSCPTEKRSQLIDAMKRDKKVNAGVLYLVIPTKIGHVELIESPGDKLLFDSLVGE